MNHRVLSFIACILALAAGSGYAQKIDTADAVAIDRDECERLGLSLKECRQVYQEKLPLKKVHQLLESGISMSEYFAKPWKELGISEKKWISKRRSGLSTEDLRGMYGKKGKVAKDSAAADSAQ